MKGRSCQAEMFARRFPMSDIPTDTDGCNEWVHNLYREKDEIYDYFARHDTFEGHGLTRIELPRKYFDLIIELTWILIIGVPSIYYFLQFLWTSSLLAQIIVGVLVILGKQTLFLPMKHSLLSSSIHRCTSNDCHDRNRTWFSLW